MSIELEIKEEVLATAEPVRRVGVGIVRTEKERDADAKNIEPSKKLMGDYIFLKPSVTALFGCSGVGKTFFTYQLARAFANGIDVIETDGNLFMNEAPPVRVFYADLELDDEEYRSRRVMRDGRFTENCKEEIYFYQRDADAELEAVENNEPIDETQTICQTAHNLGCKVVIIDNLTCLAGDLVDGATAVNIVTKIKRLSIRYKLTVVLITHTPKVDEEKPLTLNNLAGSKHLGNYLTGVIAMNRLPYGHAVYLRHVKARGAKQVEDYVVMAIENANEEKPPHFEFIKILKHVDIFGKKAQETVKILEMKELGYSWEEIGEKFHVSESKARRASLPWV